jgi:hypothetical protein
MTIAAKHCPSEECGHKPMALQCSLTWIVKIEDSSPWFQLKCAIWLSTRWQSVSWTDCELSSCHIQVKKNNALDIATYWAEVPSKVYSNVAWSRILATLHVW